MDIPWPLWPPGSGRYCSSDLMLSRGPRPPTYISSIPSALKSQASVETNITKLTWIESLAREGIVLGPDWILLHHLAAVLDVPEWLVAALVAVSSPGGSLGPRQRRRSHRDGRRARGGATPWPAGAAPPSSGHLAAIEGRGLAVSVVMGGGGGGVVGGARSVAPLGRPGVAAHVASDGSPGDGGVHARVTSHRAPGVWPGHHPHRRPVPLSRGHLLRSWAPASVTSSPVLSELELWGLRLHLSGVLGLGQPRGSEGRLVRVRLKAAHLRLTGSEAGVTTLEAGLATAVTRVPGAVVLTRTGLLTLGLRAPDLHISWSLLRRPLNP